MTAACVLRSGSIYTAMWVERLQRQVERHLGPERFVCLSDVDVRLIGATTSNPFFALVSPLVSRSQIFEFKVLSQEDVLTLLRRALADPERGLGEHTVDVTDESLNFLADVCDGDARRALNALEIGVLSIAGSGDTFDLIVAQDSIQKKAVQYDEDAHYDAASAFIKSMRGSDPDGWFALDSGPSGDRLLRGRC